MGTSARAQLSVHTRMHGCLCCVRACARVSVRQARLILVTLLRQSSAWGRRGCMLWRGECPGESPVEAERGTWEDGRGGTGWLPGLLHTCTTGRQRAACHAPRRVRGTVLLAAAPTPPTPRNKAGPCKGGGQGGGRRPPKGSTAARGAHPGGAAPVAVDQGDAGDGIQLVQLGLEQSKGQGVVEGLLDVGRLRDVRQRVALFGQLCALQVGGGTTSMRGASHCGCWRHGQGGCAWGGMQATTGWGARPLHAYGPLCRGPRWATPT